MTVSASQPAVYLKLSIYPIGHKEALEVKQPSLARSLLKRITAPAGRLREDKAKTCRDRRDECDSRRFDKSSIWYKIPAELKLDIFEQLLPDVHSLLQLRQTDKKTRGYVTELIEKHGCIQFHSGQIDELVKVFPNIRHLRNKGSYFNSEKIELLRTSFPHLSSLFIDYNYSRLSKSDAEMLAQKPSLQTLHFTNYQAESRSLGDGDYGDNSENTNGDALGAVLASSPYLKELTLINDSSGPRTVAAILKNETLQTVRLSVLKPSDSDIKALLTKPAIKFLDISYVNLRNELIDLVKISGKLVAYKDPLEQPNFKKIGDNLLRPDQDIFAEFS